MRLVSNKNVAREENRNDRVAPTTARSHGVPAGCALVVASAKVRNQSCELLRAHAKMGMRVVAEVTHGDVPIVVLSHGG